MEWFYSWIRIWKNHEYFNRFKDNDSYNDYVINMESIIEVKDIDVEKENNYILEKIIYEK